MNTNSLASHRRCHRLLAFGKTLATITGLILFVDCLADQAHAAPTSAGSDGTLEVFSSTQASQWGEGSTYFLHTGYRIYDSTGKAVKWVENHSNSADETPETVRLASGSYTIWAQSDRHGYERLSVVVKADSSTALHLEETDRKEKCVAME